MPLDENDFYELVSLLESTRSLWSIHGLPPFIKASLKPLWVQYGTEKTRDAIVAFGMNSSWNFRMFPKLLTGEVLADPKPSWQQEQPKPAAHRIVTPQPPGDVGKISDIDLSDSSPEIAEIIRRRMKRGDLGDLAKDIE